MDNIQWEAWRANLAKILTGGDQWFYPTEGQEIRNPARQHSDVAWGATQRQFSNPYLLYEHLRRTEPILRDVSDGALRSLLALGDEIVESSQDTEHLKHCEWLRKYLEKIPTQLGRGAHQLKTLIWDGVDYGSSYLTHGWRYHGDMVLPTEIQSIPQYAIRYYYEGNRAVPYFDDSSAPPHGIEFEGDQAIIVRLAARDPWRPYGWGMIASCYRHLYLYNYIYALAAEGMERHDLPWIWFIGPEGIRDMADKALDSDTRIAGKVIFETPPANTDPANPNIMPDLTVDQFRCEFKEMSRATHEIFIPWLNRLEASVSQAYTNQTLATQQTTGGEGSKAQSEVHEGSRARSEAGWAALAEQPIQTLIDRIWKYNWAGEIAPHYHIITEPEAEVNPQIVAVALQLADRVDSNGVPLISAEWLRGLIQAPEPQPGEATVEPSAVPSPFGMSFTATESPLPTPNEYQSGAEKTAKKIISATSDYAVKVARRVMPPIRKGLDDLASVYRGPYITPESKDAAKQRIAAKIAPLIDTLNTVKEDGNLGSVRKYGFDLIPLADVLTDTIASLYLAGYAAQDIDIYREQYADILTAQGMMLAEPSDIQIRIEDEALRDYLNAINSGKLHYPMTDQQWSLASAAIRRNGVTYASQIGIKLADDINAALIKAVDEGLTADQFRSQLESKWAAAGIDPASPHYLDTVLRTTSAQSYGQGQAALARTEAVDSIVWGYQMVANPGLSPHHLYHYPEMHLFAAPKNHQAWKDGWGPGCADNCACKRRTVLTREAARRGWEGQYEPTKPYVGVAPKYPQPVYGGNL